MSMTPRNSSSGTSQPGLGSGDEGAGKAGGKVGGIADRAVNRVGSGPTGGDDRATVANRTGGDDR